MVQMTTIATRSGTKIRWLKRGDPRENAWRLYLRPIRAAQRITYVVRNEIRRLLIY